MENPAAKSRKRDNGDDGDACSGSDRISRLPDPLLHHILCFLSHKKAVQTSVLSKSWRHLGPTRPIIELREDCVFRHVKGINDVCENCFDGNNEALISVLDSTFQRYHHHNIFTRELRLDMSKVGSSRHDKMLQAISVLEKWFPIMFIKPNACVNAFHISFGRWTDFGFPLVVFKVESLRELYLEGCRVKEINLIDNDVVLKNLRKLSLRYVCIEGGTLEKIMSGCPLVEYVTLVDCQGLTTFSIIANKNPYLKDFEFSCYHEETKVAHSIEIAVPTLQSIRIIDCSKWYHNHNNYFPHLKSLNLSVKLSAKSFDNFSYNFPRLEELQLFYCWGFKKIKLSSRSIKRLTIQPSALLKKVDIDVPNITYFRFSDWYVPTTFSLTTTDSREWKSDLVFSHCEDARELIEMVKALSQSQISLLISERLFFKIKQIKWGFNDHPAVVEHLVLNFTKFHPDFLPDSLHALFRIFRPRYINDHDDDEQVIEFLWKTLIHEREKRQYGWEEHLEEVSIEASDEKGKVWHHVQLTCFPEWSKNQKIRFRLKWKDLLDYQVLVSCK